MFSAEVALAPENLSVITIAMTDFHEHGHGFDDSHDKIDAVDDDRLDLVAYLFYKNHCDHCNDNGDNNDSDENYDSNEENFNSDEENYRVIYLTGHPQFQYQKENRDSANHTCCSSKSCAVIGY